MWAIWVHSSSSASPGPRPGNTTSAQAGLGQGTTVQLTWPPMITATPSRTEGRRSFPARAGSMSSKSPGAVGPASAMVAPAILPISTIRAPYQGGTQSRVSSAARWRRASLTWGSNQPTSTNLAPRS